jgi:Domain of unknown function (DUF6134)
MWRKLLLFVVPMLMLSAVSAALVGNDPGKQQLAPLASNEPEKQQLVYNVQHSKYGKIGTYTNTIEHQGDMTSITTDAKLAVSVLGVNLYRQNISRREIWLGNRIVHFHGVTTENGKAVELIGKAEGDHFAIMTPNGTTNAPADVRLANPWSRQAVDGDVILTPDSGRLETVTMTGKEQVTLNIGRRQVRTEHTQVLRGGGPGRYDVWLDEKGTPIQFRVVGDDTITFTLAG